MDVVCLDEAQAMAFAAGGLPPPLRETIVAHVDDCDSCRQVLAALVRKDTTSDWLPGTRVGRYVVRAKIGRGGMGAVWRAEDVELGRPVALKRLHAGAEQADRARLLREARAAAQLQHPNVVAVYEVGEVHGEPFLAMELVDGETLSAWLKTPRELRAITNVLAQAGRGLFAAHVCGLVHRDFKPDNVLVDRTGRARVADFGLAKPDGALASTIRRPGGSGSGPELRLTETGAISGTPAYLAPEILDGALPDARSDQYAFAITCFEALHGQHPFAGGTAEVMWTEMAEGRIREGSRDVPARLDRDVRRGLAVDPKERWPNVATLVEAIERQHRRRWPWLAGAAALVAINAFAFAMSRAPAESACESGARLVDSVWNSDVRDAQARRFAMVAPLRTGTVASAARLADDWADAWKLGHQAACHADPEQRDKRIACLDRQLDELRAQLATWATPEAPAVEGMVNAIAMLPRPDSCSDNPGAAITAPRVLVDRINAFAALQRAGRHHDALALVPALLADAEVAGDPTQLAHALVTAGIIEASVGDRDLARTYDARAAREAARAGDDRMTLQALVEESTVADQQGRPLDALGLLDAADALEMRGKLGLEFRVQLARGDAMGSLGRSPEAVAAYRRAIELLEPGAARDRARRLDLAAAHGALGSALSNQGKFDEAIVELKRALAIEEVERGKDDPEVARTLHDLGNQELELGLYDAASGHYEHARDVFRSAYGPQHELVAASDVGLANVARAKGRPREARVIYERALAALSHNDVLSADIESSLGQCARDMDDDAAAIEHLNRSLALYTKVGKTGVAVADVRSALALVLADKGRDAEARAAATLALTEYDTAEATPLERADAWIVMAEVEHRAGHPRKAIEYARQVLGTIHDSPRDDAMQVRADFEARIREWSKE